MQDWLIPGATRARANPIYQFDIRRNRRPITLETFVFPLMQSAGILFLLCLGFWLLVTYTRPVYSLNAGYSPRTQTSQDVITFFLVISLGAAILVDLAAILVSIGLINQQRRGDTWDLIQIAGLNGKSVVNTKHKLAQLYGRHFPALVVSLRVIVISLYSLHILLLTDNDQPIITDIIRELRENPEQFFFLIAGLILACAYIAEALWRYRALTAAGLYISSKVKSAPLAVILGMGAIPAMWMSQAMLLYACLVMLRVLFSGTSSLFYSMNGVVLTFIFSGFIIGFCAGVWLYYRLLTRWSLDSAARAIFTLD